MEVTDQKTFYNEEEIPNSDHFKLSSSLNLHDDILSIKYEHNIASAIGNIVSVEVEFHVPEKQPQKLTEANNSVVLTDNINYNVTRMNTKKVLLELFSRTSRTFVVTICYYQQKDLYKTAFTIAVSLLLNLYSV